MHLDMDPNKHSYFINIFSLATSWKQQVIVNSHGFRWPAIVPSKHHTGNLSAVSQIQALTLQCPIVHGTSFSRTPVLWLPGNSVQWTITSPSGQSMEDEEEGVSSYHSPLWVAFIAAAASFWWIQVRLARSSPSYTHYDPNFC